MSSGSFGDLYVEELKAARKRPAVLKMRLVILRSSEPQVIVLAFEGDDDKIVFSKWIGRLRPSLKYEPFPCTGKGQLLELRDSLERDLSGLNEGVYFFVDRDFDDLRGRELGQRTFMTDAYSVENDLVSEEVLNDLLKNEFHCHARPDVRGPICNTFGALYDEFLQLTKAANEKLYMARRDGVAVTGGLPSKIAELASVTLGGVTAINPPPEQRIELADEISAQRQAILAEEFKALEPRRRYRGKFAYQFLVKFLSLLADDYAAENSAAFGGINRTSKVRWAEIVLGSLAARSAIPTALPDFVDGILPPSGVPE